jgi:hypothetical protein
MSDAAPMPSALAMAVTLNPPALDEHSPNSKINIVDESGYNVGLLATQCTSSVRSIVLERSSFDPSIEVAIATLSNAFSTTQLVNLERLRIYSLSIGDTPEIGDDNMCVLFNGLRGHQHLTSLNLCGLGFGDRAMTALAAMCEVNTALKEVWLASGRYGVVGLQAFCQVLAVHPRLASVSFSSNSLVDDSCAPSLVDALRCNMHVTRLYISDTALSLKVRREMCDVLWNTNITLKQVDPHITWRSTPQGAAAFVFHDLIERNNSLPTVQFVLDRLVDLALALASLDLSLLELIEVFDAINPKFCYFPYHMKWKRAEWIKRAFRLKHLGFAR